MCKDIKCFYTSAKILQKILAVNVKLCVVYFSYLNIPGFVRVSNQHFFRFAE